MIFISPSTSENMKDSEQKFERYMDLPGEIRSLILSRCNFSAVMGVSLACKSNWSGIMRDKWFWKKKIESDFGVEFPFLWKSTGYKTYMGYKETLDMGLNRIVSFYSNPDIGKYLRNGADPNWGPRKEGPSIPTALWVICDRFGDKWEIVEELLNYGADPNLGHDDVTPLMIAAFAGNYTSIGVLLKRGARINDVTSFGYTALTYAVENIHETTVEVLLEWNADTSIRNRDDESVLDIARKEDESGYITSLLGIWDH